MQAAAPDRDAVDIIKEEGGDLLKLCYQCGTCSATCPWNQVRSFIVRRVMHQGQLGLIDFENEELWMCATCKACVDRCPRGVEIIDVMRAMRRAIVEFSLGGIPDSLRISMKNIAAVGNPLGEPEDKRADWAKDLDIKTFTKGTEVLYFPCCIPAYDPSVRRVAWATASVLKKAGVDFGILGTSEKCCGESVRKAGDENLFKNLADANISNFKETGVTKIVTTSSHCYNTFKNEYPELGGEFEVLHESQFIAGLIKEGKIKLTKEINKKVTYHDACYLGRHNGVYDEPRQILESIPGLELVEMTDNRENSLCCGGGGGRIWMETKKGERFCDLRLEQAIETGAEILAVACPYCFLNFEDSLRTSENGEAIIIKDIAELVDEAM
ncbi:(Fe-S)-binding protein [Chloroflexota bacterium]